MSLILRAISETHNQWIQRHYIINELVKAGTHNTSSLWQSSLEELQNIAKKTGIKLNEIQPVTSTLPQSNQPTKPATQPGTVNTSQTARPVQQPQPAASVNITANNQSTGSQVQSNTMNKNITNTTNTTTKPLNINQAMNQLSQPEKEKFTQILQKLSGIRP